MDDLYPPPAADALDAVVGRAAIDPAYRAVLLGDPATALAATALPPPLKLVLARIRAASLDQFAARALDAREAVAGDR